MAEVEGAIKIQAWIPKYIIGYILYMGFIGVIIANTSVVNAQIYDITPEQQDILANPDQGIIEFLNKAYILISVTSGYQLIAIFTAVVSIGFALAVAKALKEVIPVLPS